MLHVVSWTSKATDLVTTAGVVSSDAAVRQIARGDRRAAVDLLFRQHAGAVHSNLYLMMRDAEAARDLTQETFVRAFTDESLLVGSVPLRPWLLRVASNLASNKRRDERRRLVREGRSADDRTKPIPADPLDEVLRRQVRQELHQTVAELPLKYRQVLILRYHEGLGCTQIAEILQVPEGTVMTHLYRARAVLHRRMR